MRKLLIALLLSATAFTLTMSTAIAAGWPSCC